eukprot:CAMPEP_0116138032 /NCGR_PEP_ID=MMETSP0329-20121206/12557_1 /TAXON_ID=697910 /ORGANISM="Pseudo-nitzschia arenysensis, Strain B593" /LENGTH=245 /DNA_ID=CAMNT_0003632971 /DNA_START=76 /DNA_END=813 /DNA_ORIENTATION=+
MTSTSAKRVKIAAASRSIPKRVFCFGDSLTAGTSPPGYDLYPYARYLEKALNPREDTTETTATTTAKITVEWKGFPGWTSQSLLTDAGLDNFLSNIKLEGNEEENPPPPFDLAIILAGTNDLAHNPSSESIFNSIREIHELALDKGCTQTLALGIPPSGWQAHSEQARELAASVNQQLESWATTTSTTTSTTSSTTNYMPFPISTFDRSSNLWSVDGLHFSKEGYEYLGNALAPIVTEILSTTND